MCAKVCCAATVRGSRCCVAHTRPQSITQLRHTIADLDDELKHATAEIELARSDARHAVTEHQRLVHLQDETVNFLLQAVDDVKTQISSAIASGCVVCLRWVHPV